MPICFSVFLRKYIMLWMCMIYLIILYEVDMLWVHVPGWALCIAQPQIGKWKGRLEY